MAVTRQPSVPKVKLPAATIYLDDLEEIINILRPEGEEQQPALKITLKDLTCETFADLRQVRGRTSDFRMRVAWQKDYLSDVFEVSSGFRAEIRPDGSAQRRTWVLSQVRDIFKRRTNPFRTPWFVFLALALLFLVTFGILMHFVHRTFGREGEVHWFFVLGYGLLLGYPFGIVYSRCALASVVVLQSYAEQQGSWFRRHRDQIALHAVTSLISAAIGAAIALLVQRLLHQH